MKKITPIIVAAILIVIGCIFIAGCVSTPADPTQGGQQPAASVDKENPAYSVTVETHDGCETFSTGDIFELQFPDNGASTGYVWEVVDGKDILYKEFIVQPTISPSGLLGAAPKSSMEGTETVQTAGDGEIPLVGASGVHHFWFQPAKAGDYKITLTYARPWEGGETGAVYSQTIHVVDSDEPAVDGVKTAYIFDSFSVNPAAGEAVKVIKRANPTTGYYWTVSGEGLTIEDDYKVDIDEPGFAGSPGQYEWYVTAEKAGDYVLKAEYKHAGSDEVLSSFEIPMKFV